METVIDLMRIAFAAIYGLCIVRSEEMHHPALALNMPSGASLHSGGCHRRQRPRDVSFAPTLRVASGYTGCGGSPP